MKQIVSRQHLLSAIYSIILTTLPNPDPNGTRDDITGLSTPTPTILTPATRSHNLHSELLLGLAPNNNITDAFRRFGISDTTKDLIIVRIDGGSSSDDSMSGDKTGPGEVWKAMSEVVRGVIGRLAELDAGGLTDWARVDKVRAETFSPVFQSCSDFRIANS